MLQLLTKYRRDLHRIPETGFELPETCAYVRAALERYPCTVFEPYPSALCAIFDAGRTRTAAFRADMDALPVEEQTGSPYASTHPGKMHACGHDGHMAMTLALAELVSRNLDRLPRNVLLVFQPAEETTGGAALVCESGVFETYRCDHIFGFHLWPDLPAGTVASRPGPLLARSSEVTVDIDGKSSHIAKPEEGQDALLAAARFVCGADRLLRDTLLPRGPCLLKFGKLESGTVRNAISGHSALLGSLRVYSEEMFQAAKSGMEALASQIGAETGCTLCLHLSDGYPPVHNDEGLFCAAKEVLPSLAALERPLLIAEDFSFYQQCLPGLFLLLGTGTGIPLHAGTFDFDERVLLAGLEAYEKLLFIKNTLPSELRRPEVN